MPTFDHITTDRLTIRAMTPDDADSMWQRRNDPEAARFQSWMLPFPRERVEAMCAAFAAAAGPEPDEWWMATVADRASGAPVGDVAVHLTFDGRSAEIGATFARSHWGGGYATEAAGALADWLIDHCGVHRVHADTHPENLGAVTVLERIGMRFEGHTRASYWVGDEVSDDWLFGMTADERRTWRTRPSDPPDDVKLVELAPDLLDDVLALQTHKSQERLASAVTRSLADALVPPPENGVPVTPWPRVVLADGQVVGFVMLCEMTEHHPQPYLWRLMIDRRHQRRGIGSAVVELVVEQVKTWGADSLEVGWVPGPGSPAPLYLQHGFEPTGRVIDGEIEASLKLT